MNGIAGPYASAARRARTLADARRAMGEVGEQNGVGSRCAEMARRCEMDAYWSLLREDGGPGSGNWGHAGRPGHRGGSAPGGGKSNRLATPDGGFTSASQAYKENEKRNKANRQGSQNAGGTLPKSEVDIIESPEDGSEPTPCWRKSEAYRKLVYDRIHNFPGFDYRHQEESEKKATDFQKGLEKEGTKIFYDEEFESHYILDPDLSLEENQKISEVLDAERSIYFPDPEEYIAACEKAGTNPQLHQTKDIYSKGHDGMQIYAGLERESVLTNAELRKFSGGDRLIGTKETENLEKRAGEVAKSLSPQEKEAIKGFDHSSGAGNFNDVNAYLGGKEEGDPITKQYAENITKALDHEIGANIVVVRGDESLKHIAGGTKLDKAFNKIKKKDFSNAQQIKEELVGKVVTNDIVTSTTLASSTDRALSFGGRNVQIYLKVPKDAKGAYTAEILKLNGETRNMFGTYNNLYEGDVLFKPGMKYKIDRVDFSIENATADMNRTTSKTTGKVFITATVLTDSTQ